MKSINPYDGKLIKEYDEYDDKKIEELLTQSEQCFQNWRKTEFSIRAKYMKKAGEILKSNKEEYAKIITDEMGKPFQQSIAEIEKCAWACEYYADNAQSFLQPEKVDTDYRESYVSYQPIGAVLAIMPWNFPFWQVFRFACPTLMAGNVGLLKHAGNVSGCALAIEQIFSDAGFPQGAFHTLLVSGKNSEKLIKHPVIKAVTVTGSVETGKTVAKLAGSVAKKTVLELGGSDAYIILEDANLDKAAELCVKSRLLNSGQSCIAAKRFIVVDSIKDEFTKKFLAEMEKAKMGDPKKSDINVGPLARKDLRDDLAKQVQKSIDDGAKCLLGGEIPTGDGAFYPPTVLTNVTSGMPAYHEELFGPVAAIITAKDEQEAILIANQSQFGLGGGIFSEDLTKAKKLAEEDIQAGSCFINDFVKSNPKLPFGGIKDSGYGRELSHFGIKEFVNIKTICIK